MHVLHYHDTFSFSAGGPIRAVMDLSAALTRAGHRATICSFEVPDAPPDWLAPLDSAPRDGAPRVLHIPRPDSRLGAYSPAHRPLLDRLVRQADLVHLHGMWTPSNLSFAAAAERAGVPYIVSVRGMLDDWSMAQKPLKKKVYLAVAGKRHLERAGAVHATAEGEREQASKHAPRANWVVIPNLLDLSAYRTLPPESLARDAFPLSPAGPNVLFLSRVHYKKGVDVLLRAGALLKQKHPGLRVLIAGRGDDAYLAEQKALASSLGLDGTAHFLGQVVGEQKLALYRACDVFALPTSQENFGFVFFEALACATPLVTTRDVDTWKELESSGAGVTAPRTPEAFADAIDRLFSDPTRRARGEQARRWVFDWLDPDRILAQFVAMYEGCLTRAKAKAKSDARAGATTRG